MKLLLRGKKGGLGLCCCTVHLTALTKFNLSRGAQNTWIHRRGINPFSHYTTVQCQHNQKKTAHRKGCFVFSSLSTQALCVPLPSPSLGNSHHLSMPSITWQLQPAKDLPPCGAASPKEDERGREGASWAAATDLLNVVDILGTVSRQDKRCILCYHNIILNAHTNATKPLRSTCIILGDINAWNKNGN